MLLSQTSAIPNQLLSKCSQLANRAPIHTEIVQINCLISKLVFLVAKKITIVLKIAQRRNARNIGILMCIML